MPDQHSSHIFVNYVDEEDCGYDKCNLHYPNDRLTKKRKKNINKLLRSLQCFGKQLDGEKSFQQNFIASAQISIVSFTA